MDTVESITARALALTPFQRHTICAVLIILAVLIFVGPASAANLTPASLSLVAVQGSSPNPQTTVNAYPSVAAPVSSIILTGQLTPLGTTLYNTTGPVSITVTDASASVGLAGLAPGFVGLYQINFTVPTDLAAGDQPLVLGIGNITSLPLVLQ